MDRARSYRIRRGNRGAFNNYVKALVYQCMFPFLRSCKKRDVDSVFLVNMMSASKAAMAKDEKIR